MKRFLLFCCFFLFLGNFAWAQGQYVIISGTVTEQGTGLPVVNHEIFIMTDSFSTFTYFNIEYTNNTGFYYDSILIPIPNPSQAVMFLIGTTDCNGTFQMQTGWSNASPIIADFTLCSWTQPTCEANFFNIPDQFDPLTFQFYDVSIGNVNSWAWDFGDGSSSILQNPVHTYATTGYYPVTLAINTSDSCSSTYSDYVIAGDSNNYLCYALFNYYADSANGVSFYDSSSQGTIYWLWEFGDGTSSTQQNPYHIYQSPGIYSVCLTITTATGCNSTYCTQVFVGNQPSCDAFFISNQDPIDPFTYQFADFSAGNLISWNWDFGDGITSNIQNPVHTYNLAGQYGVTLSITTSDSCWSNYYDYVFPGDSNTTCQAQFIITPDTGTYAYIFINSSIGNPSSWSWDFGDGNFGTGPIANHTYAYQGTYMVCLTISTANGCTSSYCDYLQVGSPIVNNIFGYIIANGQPLDVGMAFLFVDNPITGQVYLVDSTIVDSIGHYGFCCIPIAQAAYYVQAVPAPNSAFYSTHLPTYYQSSAFWADADPIYPNPAAGPFNIELIPVIPPVPGTGNIGGFITQGAKIFGTTGLPMPGVEIMLLDLSNNPLMIDYSDNTGWFSFNNIPLGTYKVYPEVAFIPTNPATVNLTTSNPANNGINLIYTPNGIYTGVDGSEAVIDITEIITTYPNPAKDYINLIINSAKAETVSFSLTELSGKVISVNEYDLRHGEQMISIPLDGLSTGLYLMNISNGDEFTRNIKISVVR